MTIDEFIACIDASGVLSAEQVREKVNSVPTDERPADSRGLAVLLLNNELLTKYQAERLLEGKSAGLVLGNYLLLERLGKGGMGEVFKAVHRRMERIVAIKLVSQAMSLYPETLERFHREVKAAARLTHPNIVTAYDADESDGVQFLVLEYVEGTDLDRVVRQHGALSPSQVINIILQAARGLEYAHSKGIIHRDIKPANLILDREGTVRILDMGLARLQEGNSSEGGFTQSHHVFGSLDYMPPEQAESAKHADARSDVYSLGCTLYTLATGDVPYNGESTIQKFLAHREAPIPSLAAAAKNIPPQLDSVFRRMVAKAPEHRYQSMAELIADLEPMAGGSQLLSNTLQASSGSQIDPFASTQMKDKPGSSPSQRAQTMPMGDAGPKTLPEPLLKPGSFDTGYQSPTSDTDSRMNAGTVVQPVAAPTQVATATRELDDDWMRDVNAATASQVAPGRKASLFDFKNLNPQVIAIAGGVGVVGFVLLLALMSLFSGDETPQEETPLAQNTSQTTNEQPVAPDPAGFPPQFPPAKPPPPPIASLLPEKPPIENPFSKGPPKVEIPTPENPAGTEPKSEPPTTELPRTDPPKTDPKTTEPPAKVEAESNIVDLLAKVDLQRESLGQARWERNQGVLLSPISQELGGIPPRPDNGAILQFAQKLPDDYELNLVVEHRGGAGPLIVAIPSSSGWATIMLDGPGPAGGLPGPPGGLPRPPPGARPPPGKRAPPGRPPILTADFTVSGKLNLKIVVHNKGGRVECNGKRFTYSSQSLRDPLYLAVLKDAKRGHLVLGAVGGYRITKAKLTPLD